MATENPFEAPKADLGAEFDPRDDVGSPRVYGGLGRLAYFGLSILSFFGAIVMAVTLITVMGPEAYEESLAIQGIFPLVLIVVGLVLVALRAKNLGFSPWWGLAVMIPIYGIVVAARCLAYPEGWADHRTVDKAGKIIVGLMVGYVLLCIAAFIVTLLLAG